MKNKLGTDTAPLFVAVIMFLIPIAERLLRLTLHSSDKVLLLSGIVQLFIFAVPCAFYRKISGAQLSDVSRLSRLRLWNVPFVVSCAFTFLFGALILLYIEINVFSMGGTSVVDASLVQKEPFGAVMTYVLIPAVAEEILFRNILISKYEKYSGVLAVIMPSLFFAMLHFSFAHFLMYFLIGLVLSLMTYVTGSSLSAVILHAIYNAVMLYMGSSVNSFIRDSSSSFILPFILVVLFMLSLVTMLSSMEDLYERKSILYAEGQLPGSRREAIEKMARAGRVEQRTQNSGGTANVFLSPAFFVTVLLFVLITLDII